MSKVLVGAMAVMLLCACAVSFAYDGSAVYGNGTGVSIGYNASWAVDPWNAPPSPGIRFSGGATEVRTGHGSSPGLGYGYGGCGCENGVCLHWTQYGWYASWDDGYGHGGCGHGCRKQGACCN